MKRWKPTVFATAKHAVLENFASQARVPSSVHLMVAVRLASPAAREFAKRLAAEMVSLRA
jgi:pentose-5-phosphate-3-epimerase